MKFFHKIFNDHYFFILIILFGIFIITPFIVISYFNYPYLDDFVNPVKYREFGFWGFNKWWYFNWGGRYFSTLILSIICVFEKHVFLVVKIIPVITLLLLIYSFFILFLQFFNQKKAVLLSILLSFLYFVNIRSTHTCLFWVPSVVTYLLSGIFLIFFLAFYYKTNLNQSRIWKYLVLFMLTISLIGFNESVMLIFLLFFIFIFLINVLYKRNHNLLFLFVFIFAVICSAVFFIAPGNYVRIANTIIDNRVLNDKLNILLVSFKQSFALAFSNIMIWCKTLYLFLVSIIFIDAIIQIKATIRQNNIFNINPLLSLLLFLLVPAMYYPSFYAINFCEHRLEDLSYLIFLLVWFYNLCVFYVFFSRKWKSIKIPFNIISYCCMFLIVVLLIIKPNNVRTVYGDLLKGRAVEFKRQTDKRQLEISNCPYKECMVDSFNKTNIPYSIFSGDITPSPRHWVNDYYSKYFYKDSIYTPFPLHPEK